MKILKQVNINNKVLITIFESRHVQIDMLPLAKKVHTIDLSPEEGETLKKVLTDSVLFAYDESSEGVKPIYIR